MELMGESKRNSEQIEERMIGVLSKHLTEFELSQIHRNITMNKISLCAMGLIGMILGIAFRSLF